MSWEWQLHKVNKTVKWWKMKAVPHSIEFWFLKATWWFAKLPQQRLLLNLDIHYILFSDRILKPSLDCSEKWSSDETLNAIENWTNKRQKNIKANHTCLRQEFNAFNR